MPIRALVTGGSGFIGSYLSNLLMRQGASVHVLDIAPPQFSGAQYHAHDVGDTEWVTKLPQVDVVYHLAAVSRMDDALRSPSATYATNCTGTRNALEFALRCKAPFVYASTSCCYDELTLTPYHHTKWLGEQICAYYAEHAGMSVGIARLFNVYGRHAHFTGAPKLVMEVFEQRMREGLPLPLIADGGQKRDFIHVQDVCEALIAIAALRSRAEIFDIGTGRYHAVRELVEWFGAKAQQVPARSYDVQERHADVAATEQRLGWHAKIDLRGYIADAVKNLAPARRAQ